MRRVTFSRNYTVSLSRTCQCYCKYCAFATHKAHLYAPDEVERMLDDAQRRNAKELLVLTGEKPEVNPGVARPLRSYGHETFADYVAWTCERALDRGMLPHTNIGVAARDELARLREVTASQGLMLESINPDLVVHQGSPTKHPDLRLDCIRTAGELRIPFTSGILVGIGESAEERIEALRALAEVQAEYGHIQEVILQNFVPPQKYYGQEPAQIADETQRRVTRGADPLVTELSLPPWADVVTLDDMRVLVRACQELMPGVGIQIPPNLSDWWLPLVDDGATDLGGLSANGDHISPEHPFPSVHEMRKRLPPGRQAARAARPGARGAALRVSPVHERGLARAGRARRDQDQALVLHPEERFRAPGGASDPARPGAGRDRAGGRRGEPGRGRADRPVRRDPPRGDRGHAPGGRRA